MKQIIEQLKKWKACANGYKWSLGFDDAETWWNSFDRGDWMLWVVGKLAGEPGCEARKKLVLCACKCARLALPFVTDGEDRPLKAIETAERWANGDKGVTLADVRKAAHAAYAVHVAAHAAYAAHAAAYAAIARKDTRRKCADIVREFYTWQEIHDAIIAVS